MTTNIFCILSVKALCNRAFLACILSGLLFSPGSATANPKPGVDTDQCFTRVLRSANQAVQRQNTTAITTMANAVQCPDLADSWQSGYLSGYLQYRHARILSNARDKGAEQALKKATDALGRSIALNEGCAACHALLSAVYGMRIAGHPLRGMMLGPKASRHMKQAHDLKADTAIVYLLDGIGTLHTPGMFGGGLDKALVLLGNAVQLMKDQDGQFGWGLADAYLWHGVALVKSGDEDSGSERFRQALEVEPEFTAVKQQLVLLANN